MTNPLKLPTLNKLQYNNKNLISYVTWDSFGPTALLVHGEMRTSRSFDELSRNLCEYEIIAMDLPGHGNSTWRNNKYRFKDRSADIEILVNSMKNTSLIGVAHSTGAVALGLYVSSNTSIFKSLVLLEPMMIVDEKFQRMISSRNDRPRRTWNNKTELSKYLCNHPVTKRWTPQVIEDVVNYETFTNSEGNIDMLYSSETLNWKEREGDYLEFETTLKNISLPILMVISDERKDNFSKAFELEKEIPNLSIVTMRNTSHNMYMERPKALSKLILDFNNKKCLPKSV